MFISRSRIHNQRDLNQMKTSCLALLLLSLPALAAAASNWPSQRGPHFNGSGDKDLKLPAKFSPTENVDWKAELPGTSAATPVIVFPSGGTTDWSSVGCISVTSIAQMADAIARLAADAVQAQALGRAGQAAVLARFSPQRLLGALLAEYEAAR